MYTNLNSTGSFWISSNGNYWSYSTKMTDYYKGEFFKNTTYYSPTTRKHQGQIVPYVDFNHQLDVRKYGDWDIEEIIKDNIYYLKKENEYRLQRRKTKNNKECIKANVLKIKYLSDLLKA